MAIAYDTLSSTELVAKGTALAARLHSLLELMKETGCIRLGLKVNKLMCELEAIMESKNNTGNLAQSLMEQAEGLLGSEVVKAVGAAVKEGNEKMEKLLREVEGEKEDE